MHRSVTKSRLGKQQPLTSSKKKQPQQQTRKLTTVNKRKIKKITPQQKTAAKTNTPLQTTSIRSMAAQPAGRKAFQTTAATQAVAPNPNTSKSQFRVELLKNYNRDGYVLVKHVLTPANIEVMHNDFVSIFRGKYPTVRGLSPTHSTLTDAEVLSGFSGIEHPLKVATSARNLVFSNPQILLSLKALIGRNIKCVSSDYWIQGPGEYGRAWGQDEETIMTRDQSLVLAFIALDDLVASSGTILLHPASHKSGILYPATRSPYQQENATGSETSYDWQSIVKRQSSKFNAYSSLGDESDATEMPLSFTNQTSNQRDQTSNSTNPGGNNVDSIASVPIDMPAGSVLFVNGYTLQRMMATMSESIHRRLLRVHFTSAETPVAWNTSAVESHLFAQHLEGLSYEEQLDLRDITMVAGNDPYEYKGLRNFFPVELVRRRGPTGSF